MTRIATLLTASLAIAAGPAAAQGGPPTTDRGYGAWFGSIPDIADPGGGVLLEGTTVGSPAARAGLRKGDLITRMAGDSVLSLRDMVTVLRRHEPGDTIMVVFRRGEAADSVKVVLGVRPGG